MSRQFSKHREDKQKISPSVWVFTTYFAEGFPFVLIRTVSTYFFRAIGVSVELTGLTSLYGLPWVLKFLWAPLLDFYGTKRFWLLLTQGLLSLVFLLSALLAPFSWSILIIATLFFLASILAATHDTAIDGFYLEALEVPEQARYVGYRVMAYRIAMMFGSAVIVTLGARHGWSWGFGLSSFILGFLCVLHWKSLPHVETAQRPLFLIFTDFLSWRALIILLAGSVLIWTAGLLYRNVDFLSSLPVSSVVGCLLVLSLFCLVFFKNSILRKLESHSDSSYAQTFLSFVDRQKITAIILFIVFVRAGEFMLSAMVAPFFIDSGFKEHYGWINGAVGLPCSIIGAMIGGWFIAKYGFKKMLWPFLLAQNLTNLLYMLLAASFAKTASGTENSFLTHQISDLSLLSGVTAFDHFAGGLGTAILMTYLMGLCKENHKAAHYAIGTGLMSVSGVYAGALSGFIVAWFGYVLFFGISFIMSIPGMILIFYLPVTNKKRS